MAAKDIIHAAVRRALTQDGWTITHDPLVLEYEDRRVFVDLGAERIIGAERNGDQIAVEVKSFLGPSFMTEFERAIGQYVLYHSFLQMTQPGRKLYIGVSDLAYQTLESSLALQMTLRVNEIALVVIDLAREEIVQWISNNIDETS
jgi:hypothetical protein